MNLRQLQPFYAMIDNGTKTVHLFAEMTDMELFCGTPIDDVKVADAELDSDILDIAARLSSDDLTVCKGCVRSRPFQIAAALLSMYSTGLPGRLYLLDVRGGIV